MVGEEPPDVRVRRATELHRRDDAAEVVVEKDEVGGLPRDVRPRRAHGDADVRGAQRRSVVDAVAGHRDHMAPQLQGTCDPELVLRHDARHDHVVPVEQGTEGDVVGGEVLPLDDQRVAEDEPDLAGDRRRGDRVVSRHHRDPDPGRPAGRDRVADVVTRGVFET
ncbi:hypothetical protein GALL_517880 [mine drainage metagenome]|uniref:Uncharacterized protein n=1 Tax=mine drainage metagenome TaxID=410659 RepID=A0A1J5P793_9ZZZZ